MKLRSKKHLAQIMWQKIPNAIFVILDNNDSSKTLPFSVSWLGSDIISNSDDSLDKYMQSNFARMKNVAPKSCYLIYSLEHTIEMYILSNDTGIRFSV